MLWMQWITVKVMGVDKTNSAILWIVIYLVDNNIWRPNALFLWIELCANMVKKTAIDFVSNFFFTFLSEKQAKLDRC